MKKRIICILMALFLFAVTGCASDTDIIGTWEQTTTISILGVEGQTETEAVTRFLLLESGTGIQELIITDGSHPDTEEAFTWELEGTTLTLDYGEGRKESFTVSREKDTLTLDGQRIDFVLNKAE